MRHHQRTRSLARLAILLPLLAACTQQADMEGAPSPADEAARFRNGDAVMACTLACAYQYGAHRRELQTLYAGQDWNGLATTLLAIGADNDQSWYYLAAAAQGLGYIQAAQRYDFLSLSARFSCHGTLDNCDGLDLPALTLARLSSLDATLAASPAFAQLTQPPPPPGSPADIHLAAGRGLLAAPAKIDGDIPLLYTIDSGSGLVTVPFGAALVLIHDKQIQKSDILGGATATLANGAVEPSIIFKIHLLQVGNVTVKNVTGAIIPRGSEFLLGQSFLSQFQSWSIDNQNGSLILQPAAK